jgi:hypothetical protein
MNSKLKDLFPFCCEAINKQKQKRFEVLVSDRISNTVNAHSILRQVSDVKVFDLEDQLAYKLPNDKKTAIFLLPNVKYISQKYITIPGDKVYIPAFALYACWDIDIRYVEELRVDVLDRALQGCTKYLIDQEEEILFSVLVPAATCNTEGSGKKLKIKKYPTFSEKVIVDLIKEFNKDGKVLTHILFSEEDRVSLNNEYSKKLGNYLISPSIPFTLPITVDKIQYNITLITCQKLGALGQFNINSNGSSYGIMKVGEQKKFNDYHVSNPNKVMVPSKYDIAPIIEKKGETQVYGISHVKGDSFFKVPVRQEIQFYPDSELHKKHRLGYYGWEELGAAIMDPSCIKMAVID